MESLLPTLALAFSPTPIIHHAAPPLPRTTTPKALLPKAIVPFFFIPTYIQIGYAIEQTWFDGKGLCTRIIKSDAVQKSGAKMKRVVKESPKCRAQKLTPEALAIADGFKKEYAAKEIEFVWGALVKCYGSKDKALTAVKANEQILNPSYSFPNTILESKRMLRQVMSEEEALEVMTLNPAVLQCGPSLDLFGTDEIKMIAQMRSMGNNMVPAPLRPVLVALLVASIVLTVVAQGSDSQELLTLVDTLKPLLGGGIAVAYGGALYGAAQMGRKPSAS